MRYSLLITGGEVIFDNGEFKRIPVGALGFGIRADKINELLSQPVAKPLVSNVILGDKSEYISFL